MKYDVFISYSRKDKAVVDMFYNRLISEGFSVWIDKDGIESGDAFKHVIVNAIEQSCAVVFFSSLASNASIWTSKEIGVAIYENKPIIPIKIDNAKYNSEIKFDLINLDYIELRGGRPTEDDFMRLVKTLRHKCNKPVDKPVDEPVTVVEPTKPENPDKPDKPSKFFSWANINLALLILAYFSLNGLFAMLFWVPVLISYRSKKHRKLWNWTRSHKRTLWIIFVVMVVLFFIYSFVSPFFGSSDDNYMQDTTMVDETWPVMGDSVEEMGHWGYDTISADTIALPDDYIYLPTE